MGRIICIAGPTATGKTALAVELAKRLDGEVVSCDSMQVYRRMDIGTAKPTLAERQGIVHHMLDVAEPWQPMSVARFTQLADPVMADILARGKTAIVAGGTGLYMDALIRGNGFAPEADPDLRAELQARLQAQGAQTLLEELRGVDPETAGRLTVSDGKRIIRALEVYRLTGTAISEHNRLSRQQPPRYQAQWLGLDYEDRAELYARIDRRVEQMLQAGLLEEIQRLMRQDMPAPATALQAIGYKEFLDAFDGRCTLQEAVAMVQQSSRRYAKRQRTWFRRNPQIRWIYRHGGDTDEWVLAQALDILQC